MFERFPKLESVFVREKTEDGLFLVTDEIKPGYEWVFEDESVRAVEKIDGENIAVTFSDDGAVSNIFTREGNIAEPFTDKRMAYIVKGVVESHRRGWIDKLSEKQIHYGELIGPTVQDNPYNVDTHLWIPFEYAYNNFHYESWGEYPQEFDDISYWFEDGLLPLVHSQLHNKSINENDAYVEGVVFTHPDGRKAKLRRDMFSWYGGDRHGERN